MTEDERERAHLAYVVESIDLIRQYTEAGRETFLHDRMVQDAVLRRLETLAESSHRLSEELKLRHPAIPWREVYGFRNIAAHGYLDLRLDRVWEIVDLYLETLHEVASTELRRSH